MYIYNEHIAHCSSTFQLALFFLLGFLGIHILRLYDDHSDRLSQQQRTTTTVL